MDNLFLLLAIAITATILIAGVVHYVRISQLRAKQALEVQSLKAEIDSAGTSNQYLKKHIAELESKLSDLKQVSDELTFANQQLATLTAQKESLELSLTQSKDALEKANSKIEKQSEQLTELARSEQARAEHSQTLAETKQRLSEKESKIETLIAEQSQRERLISELQTKLSEQAEHNARVIKDLNDAKETMKQEFKLLAGDILDQKSKDFRSQHHESLEKILTPFKTELTEFKRKVEESQKEDLVHRSKLGEELKQLRKLNQQITDDADNLTKALKGEKKLQGNWGEIQLERILESSGLVKGQEYQREANFKTEEGKNQRPDFIVKLPDNKHLIIDSKVSLNAFLDYCQAETAEAQDVALQRHVSAMKMHIKTLNEKDYPALNGLQSPDFVFMFVPIEPAFNVALQADFKMFEDAFAKHIVLVTPTTLLATLKTVASIWTIEKQNKKATELASRAGLVYDKLRVFLTKMETLGNNLNSARNTYDDAMKTLRNGNGNLVSQAEQFKALGVRVKDDIPGTILARSDITDSLEVIQEG